MKKRILIASACALLLGACSENEPQSVEPQSITFQIEANVPFSTRVAEIYSSDALQAIDDVFVYVFKSTDNGASYKYFKTIDLTAEWQRGWNSVTHRLPKSEMFENGMYRFLAVGMDATTDYTISPSPMVVGSTDYTAVLATLGSAVPQELFSGLTDYTVGSSIEVIRVLMHRRVAGVLGYFTNVPAQIGGVPVRYLRLSVAGSNTTVDITSNPLAGVLPAAASGPGYNIFNVDLSTQSVANGIYTGTMVGAGVGQLANTTLVGAYVIPAGFSTGVTMTLSLLGQDGVTALRSWPVRDEAGNTTFNIRSNHFYSLGRKLQTANTNNGNTDPSDDDQPIDFQSQVLVANVTAGWDITHQMSIPDTVVP